MKGTIIFGLVTLVAGILAKDCPTIPDVTCPVTRGNVQDVFFFDVADSFSCKKHCQDIGACKYWTQFSVNDDPLDHKKCFLFKTCDDFEECDDCETGSEDEDCFPDSHTCSTEVDNILDVFYYDSEDGFSCPHACSLLEDCNFWSHWVTEESGNPLHKCFLFKDCDNQEPCNDCETGSKS